MRRVIRTKIIGCRQPVSPAAMRMLAWLETHGPATRRHLASVCFVDQRSAARYLVEMKACYGLLHIAGWERLNPAGNGQWSPLYALGPGKNARKPPHVTWRQRHATRRARLEQKFGPDLAKRILTSRKQGGAEWLAVDGRTAYRRGEGVLI